MGHLVTVTGSDAEYIKNLIVVIAQTECNAVEAVAVTTVEIVVLHSMIEVTAGEPETNVWIAVDGLSEDVRGATQSTFVEVAVASVDCGDRGACRDDYCSCAVFSSRDDRDQECGGGRKFHDQMDHGHWVTSAPRGMFAGSLMGSVANLEHPPSGGLGWTETDLKENVVELQADDLGEKIINDVVEAKRFMVRAWGGVHMSQSGQEISGAQCDDKDSDIRRIDNEECVVKDWRHTHEEAMSSKEEKQVWMQFEGRTKPWDVLYDEGGDEMERRWREKNRMEGVEMHMVSGGRVVDWNGMVNIRGGRSRANFGNRMEHPGKGVRRRNNSRSWIRRRS